MNAIRVLVRKYEKLPVFCELSNVVGCWLVGLHSVLFFICSCPATCHGCIQLFSTENVCLHLRAASNNLLSLHEPPTSHRKAELLDDSHQCLITSSCLRFSLIVSLKVVCQALLYVLQLSVSGWWSDCYRAWIANLKWRCRGSLKRGMRPW